MKKENCSRKWHIVVVVITLMAFSVLCWVNFFRSLAAPEVDLDLSYNVDQMIDDFDAMWYESMYEKAEITKADMLYTYYATGQISSVQVAMGKQKWLFYKTVTDGNPIADYEGTNRYQLQDMENILNNVLQTQTKMEERNIKFAIVIAPNKENVYSEYMSDSYVHAEISATDELISYLQENGANIVSPKEELLNLKKDYQLYYKYDTHWNQLGAYIGAKSVLDIWNIIKPELSEREISSEALYGKYHYHGEDDLAKLVGLRELVFNDEKDYIVGGTKLMDWNQLSVDEINHQAAYFNNPEADIQASLLLVGDSFGSSMIPSLRETFSDVYVIHRNYYTSHDLDDIQPDYMIAEYVERYSSSLGEISLFVK